MAVYIDILKIAEDESQAVYRFVLTDERDGELILEKKSGEIVLSRALDGDEKGLLFARAAKKVRGAWENGECPMRLIWAS